MAYQQNKPAASDKLKNSQADLQGNFQAINDFLEVNHDISTFTSPASGNEGKHKMIHFVQQSGDPTVGATEKALYTKDVGGDPHFFIKNNGVTFDISNLVLGADATFTFYLMAQYDATRPLLFKSGNTNGNAIAANSATTITFATAFPSAIAHVIVTPFKNANVDLRLSIKTLTAAGAGFTVYNPTANACDLMFFAIGR